MSDIEGDSIDKQQAPRDSRKPMIIIGIALVALLMVGVGVFVFFSGEDIPAPELDTAKDAIIEAVKEDEDATTTTPDDVPGSVVTSVDDPSGTDVDTDGAWTIEESEDDVDFNEEPVGTYAQFRIEEELASIGSTEAVGRTHGVSGQLTIDGSEISEATFEVEMTSIVSDRSQRDGRIQSALDTDEFPVATFELTEAIELTDEALEGEEFSVEAVGELTIHGVTNEVTIDIEAQLEDGIIIVVGSTEITFEDYDVEVPSSQSVITVSDDATIEVLLVFTKN